MAIVVIMTDFRVQPLETIQSQVSYSLPPCGFDHEKHRNPTAYGIARDFRTVVTVLNVDTSCRKVVSEILRGCQSCLKLTLGFSIVLFSTRLSRYKVGLRQSHGGMRRLQNKTRSVKTKEILPTKSCLIGNSET